MTPKDIKRAKHNFKQKQYQTASRQKHQQTLKDIQAGKFRDQPYRRGINLIIHQHDLQDPNFIHQYRSSVLKDIAHHKLSKSRTRSALSEFDTCQISGIVSDVIQDNHNNTKILIDYPIIEKAIFKGQPYVQEINRQLDSHIWFMASDVIAKEPHYIGDPTISVGDTIRLVADIQTYRGKVNGVRTTRYGIKHIMIIDCGIPVLRPNKKHQVHIQSHFDRKNDWSIKFKNVIPSDRLDQIPVDKDGNSVFNTKFYYQESQWPHYTERFKQLQKEGNK